MKLPNKLYHGSAYLDTTLKPGFEHTGVEVKWDQTETNRFLYATTEVETATLLGFGSAVEKQFPLNRFTIRGSVVKLEIEGDLTPSVKTLLAIPVYLYELTPGALDGWVANSNEHNGLTTEYKTSRTVRPSKPAQLINLTAWFKATGYTLELNHHASAKW